MKWFSTLLNFQVWIYWNRFATDYGSLLGRPQYQPSSLYQNCSRNQIDTGLAVLSTFPKPNNFWIRSVWGRFWDYHDTFSPDCIKKLKPDLYQRFDGWPRLKFATYPECHVVKIRYWKKSREDWKYHG